MTRQIILALILGALFTNANLSAAVIPVTDTNVLGGLTLNDWVCQANAINSTAHGWLIDGNPGQMLIQFYDVAGVFVYCAIATFIILKVIDMIVGLRVSPEVEVEGLDINLHGETVHD